MTIRRYESKDRNEVVRIWREVFAYDSPHNDPELSLTKKLEVNDGLLLVADDGSSPVGTVMGGYDGHRGWIYSLAVRSEFRGTGVGRRLVDAMVRELAARGCVKVNLQITGSNREVVGFYEKLGFSVEDRISMGLKLFKRDSAPSGERARRGS